MPLNVGHFQTWPDFYHIHRTCTICWPWFRECMPMNHLAVLSIGLLAIGLHSKSFYISKLLVQDGTTNWMRGSLHVMSAGRVATGVSTGWTWLSYSTQPIWHTSSHRLWHSSHLFIRLSPFSWTRTCAACKQPWNNSEMLCHIYSVCIAVVLALSSIISAFLDPSSFRVRCYWRRTSVRTSLHITSMGWLVQTPKIAIFPFFFPAYFLFWSLVISYLNLLHIRIKIQVVNIPLLMSYWIY